MTEPYRGGVLSGGAPACQIRSYPQNLGHDRCVDELIESLPENESLLLLDLCCGVGQFLIQLWRQEDQRWLSRIGYSGVDFAEECINGAQSYAPDLGFVTSPAFRQDDALSFLRGCEDSSFHMVAYVNSLHEHSKRTLPELLYHIFRVVRDDGRVFIFDIAALPYEERGIGSLPLTKRNVDNLFRTHERAYFPEDPVWGTAVSIRTHFGEKKPWELRAPVLAWYCVITCDRRTRHNVTVKSRMLDLFDFTRHDNFKAVMTAVIDEIKTDIFKEIHDLSYDWRRLYQPLPHMGITFDRTRREFQERKPPASAGQLRYVEEQLDIKVRDYWACHHELKSLAVPSDP